MKLGKQCKQKLFAVRNMYQRNKARELTRTIISLGFVIRERVPNPIVIGQLTTDRSI